MTTNGADPFIRMAPSGVRFYFLRPDPSMIFLRDIAWHLAGLNRYTGAVRYTVAQHSVLVSREMPKELRAWGLLHDATEAYLGDVSSPLKRLLPGYKKLETALMQMIAGKFGLPWPEPYAVKEADQRMFVTEYRDLLPHGNPGEEGYCNVSEGTEPYRWKVQPWDADAAYAIFMATARSLGLTAPLKAVK